MFSHFFHRRSRNHLSAHGALTPDTAAWPREWLTIQYKMYPNAERIALTRDRLPEILLADALRERETGRAFAAGPLPLRDLSLLLLYSCGLQAHFPDADRGGEAANTHRAQPSAGGLYPIEAYVVNFVAGELPAGVFHYNVRDHALELIERRTFTAEDRAALFVESSSPHALPRFALDAPCVLVLTAAFDRSQNKYGERGYRYCLLEAGHIAQNAALIAAARSLACAPLGGVMDDAFDAVLRIDGDAESIVYACLLGARGS